MSEQQKQGKRIVSKGEYAAQMFTKTGWIAGAFGVALTGIILFLIGSLFLLIFLTFCRIPQDPTDMDAVDLPQVLAAGVMATGAGTGCMFAAFLAGKRARKVQVDVPLTRANTVSLLVADSLVRASEPPLQAQQSILLRAATETTKGQEELLRAAAGGHE